MSCLNRAVAADATASRRRLARLLCLGSSLVGVSSLVVVAPALADVTISSATDTPVSTGTASSAGPDNMVISGGSISLSAGTAVTLNSSNSVTNGGSITIQNATAPAAGVVAFGGNTGNITNNGTITVNETATLTSTDGAGNVVGPWATGSDRFGIHVVGPGTLNGSIGNGGTITVQGAKSAAISVEAPLTGSITSTGAISLTGDNSFGIVTSSTVGGPITVTGAVTASGAGSTAISVGGDVGGALTIESAVTATGYHVTTRNTGSTAALDDQNANDNAQAGPAVSVAGSLAKGLLVSGPPAVLSSAVTDLNGDGITDSAEPSAAVTSYGSAPAIQIGAVGRDITLGAVGAGDSAYGVALFGAVAGSGVHDGVSATGLQIGVPGGGAVNTSVTNLGSLSATSFSANATGAHILAGANIPIFNNGGTLTANMTATGATAADAMVIESGATVHSILNGGTISAVAVGSSGAAGGIIDHSGSLSHLENTGSITATVYASGSSAALSVPTVAIDNSLNTTGFSMVSYKGGSTAPVITGSILMGSGADNVSILAGTVTGDLSFGAGANTLLIDGGAAVAGAVTATGGTLALSIGTGSLQMNKAERLNMPSLTLGSGSSLTLTADPAHNAVTELAVTGPAVIASGAKIGVRMISLAAGQATYAIVQSPQLSAGAIDTSLLGATSYMYDATLATDPAAGAINLTISQKTAQQLGLPSRTAGAYAAVLAGADQDPTLVSALLSETTRSGFLGAYNALLPNNNGVVFRMFSAGSDSFGRVLDERQNGIGGGAWAQEVNVGISRQNDDATRGYTAWGVGLMGGFEFPATRLGIFGVDVGGYTSQSRDSGSDNGHDLVSNLGQVGAYWRASWGALAANASVAGDYLQATNNREVTITGDGTNLYSAVAQGRWSGFGVTGRLRVSYEAWLGQTVYLRPQAGVDYDQLHEDGYTESGGGTIDLAVRGRDSSEIAGFAGLAIGAQFGPAEAAWGPELLLGYRDAFHEDLGATTAQFLTGGSTFTVGADNASGSGPVARLALKSESAWGAVAIEGGAEEHDHLTLYDLRLAAHFTF